MSNQVENRLKLLEITTSDLLTAIRNFVTNNQVNELRMINEGRIEMLEAKVAALEDQVQLLINTQS